jgi:hypothetical protein
METNRVVRFWHGQHVRASKDDMVLKMPLTYQIFSIKNNKPK